MVGLLDMKKGNVRVAQMATASVDPKAIAMVALTVHRKAAWKVSERVDQKEI